MMRIVPVNTVTKSRVKEMIKDLMPQICYVRITNLGLVVLKKKWYSIKRINTTITDLLIGTLPSKIAQFTDNKVNGTSYFDSINRHIAALLTLRTYNVVYDVCDYIWSEYNKHCKKVESLIITSENEFLFLTKNDYLPSIKKVHSINITEFFQNIIKDSNGTINNRFKKSVYRMRNYLPSKIFPSIEEIFNIKFSITT